MATRKVKSSNDFFDILDRLKNNTFVTIGYVTGANLDVPKVKRKNPDTGRMKGYPDYTVFKQEGYDQEIGALVKITTYNFRYYNRAEVAKQYADYKQKANAIRINKGLEPIKDRESYKSPTEWSNRAPEIYKGNNSELEGHSYNPQNMHGANIKGTNYVVDVNGNIIRALTDNEILPYLKAKREPDGVAALRKMGVEEEEIKDYIEQIENLKFKYKNFESNSILWMAATVNGEKIVYINDSLQRAVDDININPSDFRQIARERYQISLEMLGEMIRKHNKLIKERTNKNVIRLTESQLKNVIIETVTKMLNENTNWTPPEDYANLCNLVSNIANQLGFTNDGTYFDWETTVEYEVDGLSKWGWENYVPGDDWEEKDVEVSIPIYDFVERIENNIMPDEYYGDEEATYQWFSENLTKEMFMEQLEEMAPDYVEEEYYDDYEPDYYDEWRDRQYEYD